MTIRRFPPDRPAVAAPVAGAPRDAIPLLTTPQAVLADDPIRSGLSQKGGAPSEEDRKNGERSEAEQRLVVRALASVGVPHEVIARALGHTPAALRRRHRADLERGLAEADAQVVTALFKAATQGSIPAAKWWTQTRLGWRERGEGRGRRAGSPTGGTAGRSLADLSDAELVALLTRLAAGEKGAMDAEGGDGHTVIEDGGADDGTGSPGARDSGPGLGPGTAVAPEGGG